MSYNADTNTRCRKHHTFCIDGRLCKAGVREGQGMRFTRGARLGHYDIRASLGAGGMGEVYRAKDSRLGREVAIKVLHEHLSRDPEAMHRFEQEARAVAVLSHPNILAIH